MKLIQSFQLAIKSIRSNRMRSILTMLGMIIGVASVIIIMGVMNALKTNIASQFTDYGTDTLTVGIMPDGSRRVGENDIYQIAGEEPELFRGVSPMMNEYRTVSYESNELPDETVYGVAENYLNINGARIKDGRDFCYADIMFRQPNCIIGTYVASELFGDESPLGKTIKVDGVEFKVIGIRAETAGSQKYMPDDVVFLPYTKSMRMGTGTVNTYVFAVNDPKEIETAKALLESRLNKLVGNPDHYYINSMADMLKMLDAIMNMLTAAIAGIAAISLLVAGIGIMNIMLVSVTERTREIGIRKSLGARKKDIRGQFLMESGVVSGMGGIMGILFGVLVVYLIRNIANIDARPTVGAVVISFSVSVGVGMLFGFMPAKKAANLNPIDALRSE